jgi:hypothetical protein
MKTSIRTLGIALFLAASVLTSANPVQAQLTPEDFGVESPCCDVQADRVVWLGDDPIMSFNELATYCGPILWFSPDEPLLRDLNVPQEINIPMNFPFEDSTGTPVVYYRVRNIIQGGDGDAFLPDSMDLGNSLVDLSKISAIDIDFFFYYPSEEGLGGHVHDVESVEMKLGVWFQKNCTECRYGVTVERVNAKAHGILWYDNTLIVDRDTRFPFTVLVEEGKHASCTDKNGDGYYTPAYDVNIRINDAWGVRDVMRTGSLFSGGFQSWYAKVRAPEDRVFPPLPEGALNRDNYEVNGVYAPGYQKYELRPWPALKPAEYYKDPRIIRFVDKDYHDWPYIEEDKGLDKLADWFDEEDFAKSLSLALRVDGNAGISIVFPLFIVKNFYVPVSGGWLVNRLYFTDHGFRDIGYNIIYTSSASRWVDGYFSLGLEWDTEDSPDGGTVSETSLASEAGLKFRANIAHSPLRFMGKLTDFWGLRAGIRYLGGTTFKRIGYVVEFGAGTF